MAEENLFEAYSAEEKVYDDICTLLNDNMFATVRRAKRKAEQAATLIEDFMKMEKIAAKNQSVSFDHFIRGMVHFPDCLQRCIDAKITIVPADLAAMFARCCEMKRKPSTIYNLIYRDNQFELSQPTTVTYSDRNCDFASISLEILLTYLQQNPSYLPLKLMWSQYELDTNLIDRLAEAKVVDPSTNKPDLPKYPYPTDSDEIEAAAHYYGYRDTIHLCQVKSSRNAVIVNHKKCPGLYFDCCMEGLCAYLGISFNSVKLFEQRPDEMQQEVFTYLYDSLLAKI